jgi:hypothetical protein
MAKASFTFPNGTVVQIEGSKEEVKNLLAFYSSPQQTQNGPGSGKKGPDSRIRQREPKKIDAEETGDLTAIINQIKTCGEAENIERRILDRTSLVDRVLLPLYIVHEYLNNAFGLSSGEINKITTDLSVPVSQPNASRTLSGTAAKYVVGDRVRKKGQLVRYKLSRRGVKYLKAVISGTTNEQAK